MRNLSLVLRGLAVAALVVLVLIPVRALAATQAGAGQLAAQAPLRGKQVR